MESVADEIVREILLKLGTRDVSRCRCVSRLWRGIARDRSFLALHARAAHVVSGASEALLVSEIRAPGRNLETVVFGVSSSTTTPMCRFADLAAGAYLPTNACNGFLCLAAPSAWRCVAPAPVIVCNPATGEKLRLPPPAEIDERHMFTMGFSPSTQEYKLFRLSFPLGPEWEDDYYLYYLDVYTLGAGGGWRCWCTRMRRPYHAMNLQPPAVLLVDGKLYTLTKSGPHARKPDALLAIDVAGEALEAYSLPKHRAQEALVDVLDLRGRLCVALHELDPPRRKLHFWVHGDGDQGWELRYSFDMDYVGNGDDDEPYREYYRGQLPRGAWLDDAGVLCYLIGDRLYMYDTTRRRQYASIAESNKVWDHRLRLPSDVAVRQWNVYGGYRPSLISPHHLGAPQQDDEMPLEHGLLRALRCGKSSKKRRRSPCPPADGTDDCHAAKCRVCRPTLSFLDDILT